VKRYYVEIGGGVGDPYCECIEDGSGDWVYAEEAIARIDALQKENEKLKTALEDIVRRDSCRSGGPAIECRECAWCIADQALGGGR
jgi:hypothetical protein